MKEYIYMIQATLSPTDIVYTVYANTEEQMQQEIADGLRNGYVMLVACAEKKGGNNEND